MLVVHDPRCLGHRPPAGYPERPERLSAILAGLGADPRFELVDAAGRVADEEALDAARAVHGEGYVARLRRAVARGDGLIDGADTPLSPGTFEAALGAAAATLAALDAAAEGGPSAFAAVRPPGHHAEHDLAMGFCYFNNVALAAERALSRHGAGRVAIVDVDVHHGNGTQHRFEARPDVLFASLHQYPFYPGSGAADERGTGAGEGMTINVPLAAGGGDGEWLDALRSTVLPAVERFAPALLLVSAGFDAWRGDPLGGMRVTEAGYAAMGDLLRELAERRCAGRQLTVLEGGYDVEALPRLAAAFLAGIPAGGRPA